ncbi:MAG: tRNA uridine-5-carboxymethylaminomethyl(34) synthesis GTPase MnmE, partial [Chloroflexi bacterium]|nr:tRNA uridine-5-carboxymethylaminomethyl(34) synthesis GTPase MnmE [Chloroflexota bacterium]
MYDDTIAAIATPPGEGGLGIVRLSGPDAWSIVGALFDGALEDRRVVHGWIRDPATGDTIDEVMVTPLAGPKTYTRESIVEIGCHGSPLVLQRVLQLALNRGARLANPGEFTLRAFLNGRLDLSRAEAVLDVIQAKTQANLRFAVQGMQGRLSESLSRLRQRILTVQAYLTACIDFPEDEVESQIDIDPKAALAEAINELRQLIEVAEAGMIYRNGVRTAIVGKPNVGKSSLLNRLLGEDRSIVTAVPGTTRDTVEEAMQIAGIPFHLIDTAGIHETRDMVEQLGVERSREAARSADLLLVVVDGSEALSEADFELL